MMISAYGGYDLIMKAYKEAIKENIVFTPTVMQC